MKEETTQNNYVVKTTEGGNQSPEGRSDTDNETKREKDDFETEIVNDSVNTTDGGSHRIEGGPDIDN